MKTQISAALGAFLDDLCTAGVGGSYAIIDLCTVTLTNGTPLRWAAWPVPVTFPASGIYAPGSSVGGNTRVSGQTFSAAGPYLNRSTLTQGLKLEVSQIKLTLLANPLMTVGTTPILAAITSGMFNGATVFVDRLFTTSLNPMDFSLGTVNRFVGQVAEIEECGRAKAVLSIKDPTALLSDDWPRNLYLTGCRHSFGDAGCTFDKATVQVSGSVVSGSTTVSIVTSLSQVGGLSAPSAPMLTETASSDGVNLPSQTYYVVTTFVGANGESGPSPESSLGITGSDMVGANGTTDKLLVVAAPSTHPSDATGWNVYVGLASGNWQLQNSTPLTFGSGITWEENGGGLSRNGIPPPSKGTNGYFSGGVITFVTGALAGLSQQVTDYGFSGGHGVVTTSPPLPSAPASGDTFTIVPDCDQTITMCSNRYSNLIHFSGQPWIPLPEQSV